MLDLLDYFVGSVDDGDERRGPPLPGRAVRRVALVAMGLLAGANVGLMLGALWYGVLGGGALGALVAWAWERAERR